MKPTQILAGVALAALAAAPALADRLEYRVLTQSRDIGHYIVDTQGGRVSVDFDYKQNGRGPTLKESLRLDSGGFPLQWAITGRTTFGNPVNESFRWSPRGAEWHDLAGPGRIAGANAPRFYVGQNSSPS